MCSCLCVFVSTAQWNSAEWNCYWSHLCDVNILCFYSHIFCQFQNKLDFISRLFLLKLDFISRLFQVQMRRLQDVHSRFQPLMLRVDNGLMNIQQVFGGVFSMYLVRSILWDLVMCDCIIWKGIDDVSNSILLWNCVNFFVLVLVHWHVNILSQLLFITF